VSVVLPWGDENILILCGAVSGYEGFEELCPPPVPPRALKPGGLETLDVGDKGFIQKMSEHSQLRTYWLIKESLKSTPELVWDGVDDNVPSTWDKLETELNKAFTENGVSKIIEAVLRANGLSEAIVGEARESFLASQLLQNDK